MGETTGDWTALQLALDLHRDPWGARRVRQQPLPGGMRLLLTLAAGDDAAFEAAAVARLGRPSAAIREAATFFIEQILLAPGTDSYRVLGARPSATAAELRHNMALLMRWLHPDVARDGEPAVLAARIADAWNRLKTPERRAAYDRERQGGTQGSTRGNGGSQGAGDSLSQIFGESPPMPAEWAPVMGTGAPPHAGSGRGHRFVPDRGRRRKGRLPRLLAFWLLGRSRY